MARLIPTQNGNARNNSLYGTAGEDVIDGGAGNDYLRGYGGDDFLIGGSGADRFAFERTLAANGLDTIVDYSFLEGDVLDFSLVGFARGVFNRYPLSDIVRLDYTQSGVRVQVDLDGGGDSFQTWAVLANVEQGASVRLSIGGGVAALTAPVLNYPPQITSFQVNGVEQLSVTLDKAGLVALRSLPGMTELTPSIPVSANTPTTISVAAQATLTVAALSVSAELNGPESQADTLVYLGTSLGSDYVLGSLGADIIFGFDGDDLIFGEDGADTVQGGAGNDQIWGGAGSDDLSGGAGNDVFVLEGRADLVGDASIQGGDGTDVLVFVSLGTVLQSADFARVQGFEVLGFASDSPQSITLGAETNAAFASGVQIFVSSSSSSSLAVNGAASTVAVFAEGYDNADSLTGGSNNDSLTGNAGNDTLVGGGGVDVLTGGSGGDRLTGGAGADRFAFDEASDLAIAFVYADTGSVVGVADNGDTLTFGPIGTDVITDFVAGVDQLDFASPVFQGVDGAGTLNVRAGQLNYGLSSGQWGTVRGNYDAVNGVFTLNSAGTDTLLGVNTFDPQTLPASFIVLVGTPTISDSSFVDVTPGA